MSQVFPPVLAPPGRWKGVLRRPKIGGYVEGVPLFVWHLIVLAKKKKKKGRFPLSTPSFFFFFYYGIVFSIELRS